MNESNGEPGGFAARYQEMTDGELLKL